ncbi:MAG: 8-oxoguanine DNA glycosylase [Clostridia bacterium]|nr:8-oxoguanine DNA glycosylase [Clostridia bacterium]
MEHNGYKVREKGKSIVVEGVGDFNPVHIFECGQCFRWVRQDDGSYTGVAAGRAVNVSFLNEKLIIQNSTKEDFADFWHNYFDLGRDYSKIKAMLSKDDIMRKAIEFGWGIRLLRQDIWETLISFIISANNRIPMIMKTVAAISKVYGTRIEFDGKDYYSFPSAESLRDSEIEQLEVCRGGFRCKYILQTAKAVAGGFVDLSKLGAMSTPDARDSLMKLPGVGPKVADCVLLFSGTKHDVFPTDVWIKRVMEELYFKREASMKEIQDFAAGYFGSLAGIAQQYLFYYARENKIGSN